MKLKKIGMSDVLCYEDAEVELSDSLTVLTGDSDSGKSVVIRALLQAGRNEPQGANLLRHGSGRGVNSEVTLTGEADGGEFEIRRTRGRSTNEYIVNGDTLRAIGSGSPEEVGKILNLSPNAIQTQWDGHFLLSATDGQIARTIGSAIGLAEIDKMFAHIRGIKSDNDATLRAAETTETREAEALARYGGITDASEVMVELEDIDTELQRLSAILLKATSARNSLVDLPDVETLTEGVGMAKGHVGCCAELGVELAAVETRLARLAYLSARMADDPSDAVSSVSDARDNLKVASDMGGSSTWHCNMADKAEGYRNTLAGCCDCTEELAEVKYKLGKALEYDLVVRMNADVAEDAPKRRLVIATHFDARDDLNTVATAMDEAEALHEEWHTTGVELTRMSSHRAIVSSIKNTCAASNREVMQAKSAVMKFKIENADCPECGAKQEHWQR